MVVATRTECFKKSTGEGDGECMDGGDERGLQFRQCGRKRSQMKAIFEKSTKEIRKGVLPMGKRFSRWGRQQVPSPWAYFLKLLNKFTTDFTA